jgi:hypothetical protein
MPRLTMATFALDAHSKSRGSGSERRGTLVDLSQGASEP